VAEITRLCGYLPLAIGMLARQLHHHPSWSPAGRAAELAAAVDRLELLETENVSVAAAFDLSYADLTPDQQRLFRRLGLHPGTDIDGYAAAALDGTGVAGARRGLEALYEQYLLTEPAPGRYRMHDLIREHVALTAGLAGLLGHDGPWVEAITRHASAVQAARQLGDRPGQAGALTDLGNVRHLTGDYLGAARDLDEALGIFRDLGHRLGQANALSYLGRVRRLTGNLPAAARDLQEAMSTYHDIGNLHGEVTIFNESGTLSRIRGDLRQAWSCHQQALDLARQIGSAWDEAEALADLGRCARDADRTAEAETRLRHALAIFQRIGAAEAADVSAELDALPGAPRHR
jgi:tetratricopeptide (TPR) repeat protein